MWTALRSPAKALGIRKRLQFNKHQLAWAAILFEAAKSDQIVKTVEITAIQNVLRNKFMLDTEQAATLCERHSRDDRQIGSRAVLVNALRTIDKEEADEIYAALIQIVLADDIVVPEEEMFLTASARTLDADR